MEGCQDITLLGKASTWMATPWDGDYIKNLKRRVGAAMRYLEGILDYQFIIPTG